MDMFNLKTDLTELKSANDGAAKMEYEQISASRDISNSNFTSGSINFRFSTAGNKWIDFSQSYLRFRVSFTANDGVTQLANAANVAPAMNLCSNLFQSLELRMNGKTISRVSDFVAQVDTLSKRMTKSKSWLDSIGASLSFFQPTQAERKGDVTSNGTGRKLIGVELVWQPPLSMWLLTHAIPGSADFELILNPQTAASIERLAIESTGANKVPGAADSFRFAVQECYLLLKTVEGPRVPADTTYLLDLVQLRCQSDNLAGAGLSQRHFEVSPSTKSLTFAFQDGRIGSNTLTSGSRFVSYSDDLGARTDQALIRFFAQYDGQSLPSPDSDASFTATVDNTGSRYAETQLYLGAYGDTGGAESIQDWATRGSYYHFEWPRDASSRATRVQVNTQFLAGTEVANTRVLCFDTSTQIARVRMESGRIVDIQIEDA